eukprot:TRINITY_DN13914_c0_g1_i1.p2 TRINITY_DN13914_c0_g1~~TRINITY_DN13914_c0_g1_i1.p2  ORF type:complete len:145 (-),score=17.09 TRINITY_DN13914_c0_g1_i1:583-1017(-)
MVETIVFWHVWPLFEKQCQSVLEEGIPKLPRNVHFSYSTDINKMPRHVDILVKGNQFDKKILAAHPEIQRIIIPWAGIIAESAAVLMQFPNIKIHSIHHNAHATSEHAIALMLAAGKHSVLYHKELADGKWIVKFRQPPKLFAN